MLPKIVLSYEFTRHYVWLGVQWEDRESLLVFLFRKDDGHGGLDRLGEWKEDVLEECPSLLVFFSKDEKREEGESQSEDS